MPVGSASGCGRICRACGAWLCTPETPFDRQQPRAHPPMARETPDSQRNGWPGGDIVKMKCPVCNETWEQELPQ